MFVITGITGQVGGAVARTLLASGQKVRAVLRDESKAAAWAAQGCETVLATYTDAAALTQAFSGADGVFLMVPPNVDPEPGFPQIREIAAIVAAAIRAAQPKRVVFLSTVGAQVTEPNLLNNSGMLEDTLRQMPVPVTLLRAAWFMENASWDVDAARKGVIPTFLQPLDHPIPMVATADIGSTAAELLQESWTGVNVVELEGPRRYCANDIARGFAAALGHSVRMEEIPRSGWEALLRSQGMQHPMPRMRMVDGFNEGWIDFEGQVRKGSTTLESVLETLVSRKG